MSKTGRAGMGAAWRCMIFTLAAVLLVMSFATAASAATYYVAKTGNDNNPGTEAQPWLTITKAANTLVAGDTVYVKEGTYAERVVPVNSGAAGAWIQYLPYPGDTVTIDGANVAPHRWSWIGLVDIGANKHYIEFTGFRIVNSKWAAIKVNDPGSTQRCSNITLRNNYIGYPQNSGILIAKSDNCIVDGNEIDHACMSSSETQEILSIQADCNGIDVMNNYVHGVGTPSQGGEGIDIKSGSSNVNVHHNIVTEVHGVGIYVDAFASMQSNVQVYNNLVFNNTDCVRAMCMAAEAGGTLENVNFYNNLVYGNGPCSAIVVGGGDGTSATVVHNCSIINNTVYNNGSNMFGENYGGIDVGLNTTVGSYHDIVIRNNIVSQAVGYQIRVLNDPRVYNITVDYNLIDGFRGVTDEVKGTDYVEGDPGFVNAAGGDFHLLSNSIALNAGSSVSAPAFDYDGVTRPQGGGWDIGAFELVSGPVPPVANFSGNPTSGAAPLTVAFTDLSTGSPTSWSWSFGDGGTSAAQNPSHQYTAVNAYTVSLTVQNAQGQDSETKPNYITVSEQPQTSCHVGAINLVGKYKGTGAPSGRGYYAEATITAHDQACAALAGVTVSITWSGCVSGTSSGVTNDSGQVLLTSPVNPSGGTFTCTVTNLAKSGYPYQSGDNHETSDSIQNP